MGIGNCEADGIVDAKLQSQRIANRDAHAVRSDAHNPPGRARVLIGPDERAQITVSDQDDAQRRSEEHTSELQSLMRISYAVFCLKKKNNTTRNRENRDTLEYKDN